MRPFVFALLLIAAPAHADVHAAASFGLGSGFGPLSWSGAAGSWDTALGGLATDVDVSAASDLSSTLALGLALDARVVGSELQAADLQQTVFDTSILLDASVRAVVRQTERSWCWRLGAGVTWATFSAHGTGERVGREVVTADTVLGPSAHVALARRIEGLATVAVEVRAAALFSAHTTYVPVFVALRVGFGAI